MGCCRTYTSHDMAFFKSVGSVQNTFGFSGYSLLIFLWTFVLPLSTQAPGIPKAFNFLMALLCFILKFCLFSVYVLKLEGHLCGVQVKSCPRSGISCFKYALATPKIKEGSCLQHSFLLLGWCLLISLEYFQTLTPTSYKPQSGNCWVWCYNSGDYEDYILQPCYTM
jgi:hypothetical protein